MTEWAAVGIDPSTETGYVRLGKGEWTPLELTADTKQDPKRMRIIAEKTKVLLSSGDVVCIEDFSHGSKGQGVGFQYGLGYLIRDMMDCEGINYYEPTPNEVKKFATGKGTVKKDNMVLPIYKRWQFEHDSDNVRDAFVLAKIAEAIARGEDFRDKTLTQDQRKIVEAVIKRRDKPTDSEKPKKATTGK